MRTSISRPRRGGPRSSTTSISLSCKRSATCRLQASVRGRGRTGSQGCKCRLPHSPGRSSRTSSREAGMSLDRGTLGLSMLLTLGSTACGGLESAPAGGRNPFAGDASATVPADATTDASGPDAATDAAGLDTAVDGSDPGRVSIHRLSQAEYANTVRDLLGVSASPDRAGFHTEPAARGIDNNADMLSGPPAAF